MSFFGGGKRGPAPTQPAAPVDPSIATRQAALDKAATQQITPPDITNTGGAQGILTGSGNIAKKSLLGS